MMVDSETSPAWSFYNPTRIHVGTGVRRMLQDAIGSGAVLIVTSERGHRQFENDAILGQFARDRGVLWADNVRPNPGLADFEHLSLLPNACAITDIVAFGGGSAIDSAKAAAALLACHRQDVALRDIISQPGILDSHSCPAIHALPTTAGTGSEVTPFATIWDHANHRKLSLNHSRLFPANAIVDAELTFGLPLNVTIATALDALNQAFESVWNRNATPYTLRLAAFAIERALYAIPELARDTDLPAARCAMAEASLAAGICISQTRTAICHSISYPLTAHFGVPHGVACAFSMRAVAEMVLAERPYVLEQVARLVGADSAGGLITSLGQVLEISGVKRQLQPFGLTHTALEPLLNEMVTPGRSDNFIVPLDQRRLSRLISASIG